MSLDLSNLSPEDWAALKTKLDSMTDVSGRSPFRSRQLHDLRLLPTKDDPRPTFFWSAEAGRDQPVGPGKPYPALVWHVSTGEEKTIHSDKERAALGSTWSAQPPNMKPLTAEEELAELLTALSPDDRATIIKAQQASRMTSMQEKLAALKPETLEALLASIEKPGKKKTA